MKLIVTAKTNSLKNFRYKHILDFRVTRENAVFEESFSTILHLSNIGRVAVAVSDF